MSQARFCVTSLFLVMLAIGVHFAALDAWSHNMKIRARAVSVTQENRPMMRAQADRFSQRGSVLYAIGVCLSVAAATCLITSFRRHESASWRSLPVALLVFYLIFQFVLV